MFRTILQFTAALTFCASGLIGGAQPGDDTVRVTVTINPDGSKTVYQTDAANHRATAITTGENGKAQGKTIYQLDADGPYESGQVFAPNGSLRFKTRYHYDPAGRLSDETHLGKDDSVLNKIVYSYDAAGHSAGYAIYDGNGRLIGHTTERKQSVRRAP